MPGPPPPPPRRLSPGPNLTGKVIGTVPALKSLSLRNLSSRAEDTVRVGFYEACDIARGLLFSTLKRN